MYFYVREKYVHEPYLNPKRKLSRKEGHILNGIRRATSYELNIKPSRIYHIVLYISHYVKKKDLSVFAVLG